MTKIIVGFEDTGSLYVFDTAPTISGGVAARYTHVGNTDDLVELERVYGPRLWYPTQGRFDQIRTKYGLGD